MILVFECKMMSRSNRRTWIYY